MKVVLSEFHQESNSFNPEIVKKKNFEYYGIYEGKDLIRNLKNKPSRAISGMINVLEKAKIDIIPAVSMYSQSGGKVDHSLLEWFLEKVLSVIEQNWPIDGFIISLHGATQTTKYDDASGYIIEKIRDRIGEKPVISASADLHANVTKKIIKNIDFICGYQTYPHTDYYETGQRAANLLVLKLLKKKNLHLVRVGIPMIVPANGYSTLEGPFAELMKYSKSLIKTKKLIDFSIFMMQPWLDVEEGATSVITVSENQNEAKKYALEIAHKLYDIRDDLKPKMYTIEEVINLAEKKDTKKPVILVDCADSTNAGSTGDNIDVIKKLLDRKSIVKTAFMLNDSPAVIKAHELGVGKIDNFTLGGTRNPELSKSIKVNAYIKSLHDGIFTQEGPAGRGITINIGYSAVLRIKNIDLLVCHNLAGNGDPQLYRAFGIEPTFYDLVIVKACTSFRAAYQLFAGVICQTLTPGAATSDLKSLEYKKLPKYFYPFNSLKDYQFTDISYG